MGDPPQRFVELHYQGNSSPYQLFHSVTLNSPDFGLLLHRRSAAKVTRVEQGVFCEQFVGITKKWGICPQDLAKLTGAHEKQRLRGATEQRLEQKKSSENDHED